MRLLKSTVKLFLARLLGSLHQVIVCVRKASTRPGRLCPSSQYAVLPRNHLIEMHTLTQ